MSLEGTPVLVIGGAGNIGSHVVDALIQQGAQVTVYDSLSRGRPENLSDAQQKQNIRIIDGDIADCSKLREACQDIDTVFHLAAAWLLQAMETPRIALDVNVIGSYNVLEAAAEANVGKVIFSSAGAVYGDPRYVPIDEDHPLDSTTAYGASKIAGEKFCEAFYQMYGLEYVALRYWNVYGPRSDVRGSVASIIPRWLDRIEKNEPVEIFGDGNQTMDFIYVTEIARANVLAAMSNVTNDVFNVGSGVETSANELADRLTALTPALQPVRRTDVEVHVRRRCADVRKASDHLGFKSQVTIDEGLKALIEWRKSISNPI